MNEEQIKTKHDINFGTSTTSIHRYHASSHYDLFHPETSLNLLFQWLPSNTNYLDGSVLNVKIYEGEMPNSYSSVDPNIIVDKNYSFDINTSTKTVGWSDNNRKDHFYDTKELLDVWMRIFIDKIKSKELG